MFSNLYLRFSLLLAILGLCFALPADADLFLKTPTDKIIKNGQVELSLLGHYFHKKMAFDYGGGSDHQIAAPVLNAMFGLGDRVDFELNWDVYRFIEVDDDMSSDFGDVTFFTKIKIRSEDKWPSLVMRIGAKLPNASDETHAGTDLTDVFVWWLAGKTFNNLHLFGKAGLEIIGRRGGGQRDAFGYGLAVTYAVCKGLMIGSEIEGRYEKNNSPINEATFGLSASLVFSDHWKVFANSHAGLISESENISVSFGVTRIF